MTPARRRSAAACAVLVGASLAVFWPVFANPSEQLLGSDLTRYFEPQAAAFFEHWSESGEPPLWNPHSFSGQPWIDSERTIFLYPPCWILFLVPPGFGLGFLLWLHLMAAGLSMYAFLRSCRRSRAASLLGALTFELSGQLVGHAFAGHLGLVLAAPYLPLIALAARRLARRHSWGAALLLGLSFSPLILLGALQLALMVIYALSAFFLIGWMRPAGSRASSARGSGRRTMPLFALALLFGAALGAIRGLPLVSGAESWPVPEEERVSYASTFSMEGRDLLRLLLPFPAERPVPGASDVQNRFFWEITPYIGILPLAFLLIALFAGFRERATKLWAALLAASLVFAFGEATPLFGAMVRVLPGLDLFGVCARSLLLFAGAASVLAAAGLDLLLEQARQRPIARATYATSALLILALIGLAAAASERAIPERGFLEAAVFLLAGASLLFAAASTGGSRVRLAGAAVLLAAVELVWTASPLFETAPTETMSAEPSRLLSIIEEEGSSGGRLLDLSGHLPQELTARRGIERALGYEARVSRHYIALFNRAYEPYLPGAGEPLSQEIERVRYHQIFELLAIEWIVSRRDVDGGGLLEKVAEETIALTSRPAGSEAAREVPLYLYRNVTAVPRAYLVPEVRLFEERAKILEELQYIEPRRYACVESEPLEESGLREDLLHLARRETFFGPFERVELERAGTDRLKGTLHLERPRYLIVSQSFDPGWRAWSGGEPLPLLRANYAQMALFLDAGEHELELVYEPTAYRAGKWITLAAALLAIAAAVVGAARFRRQKEAERDERTLEEEHSDEEPAQELAHGLS